jgi:hypothetical protein
MQRTRTRLSSCLPLTRPCSTMAPPRPALPYPRVTASACAAAARLAVPHRLRGASSSVAHHPCFLPLAAVACTPACSTAFLVDAHFVFARCVLQCQTLSQFPSLVRCLLEDDSLRCTKSRTYTSYIREVTDGAQRLSASQTQTVFPNLAPMLAVPVVLPGCAQLHLLSMCD